MARNSTQYRLLQALFAAGLALVWGCAKAPPMNPPADPAQGVPQRPLTLQFSNIPIPSGFTLDREKTFIYESGSGNVKVGRLHFSVWNPVEEVVEYFRNEMGQKGWRPIRIIEHKVTVMMYETDTELATVIVQPSLGKTQIEIQVGPK